MPKSKAREIRQVVSQMIADGQTADLELKRSAWNRTGFTNVTEVKPGLFQARVQVKGDGRGGCKKRKQVPLNGLFPTALEAAVYKTLMEEQMYEKEGKLVEHEKTNKPHKPRTKPAQPQQPVTVHAHAPMPQQPATAVMGVPVPFIVQNVPFAAASPLPMRMLEYTPPYAM